MCLIYGLFEKLMLFIESMYENWKLGREVNTGKYTDRVILRKATPDEKEEYTKNEKSDNVWVAEDDENINSKQKYINFLNRNLKNLPSKDRRW